MLPFAFLTFSGNISNDVGENLVMVACQLIMKRVPHGGAEVSSVDDDKDVLWTVWAETDQRTFQIGPYIGGALFKGWGGERRGERILSPFETTFVVNPAEIGADLMKICATDPDGFLDGMRENFRWQRFFVMMKS